MKTTILRCLGKRLFKDVFRFDRISNINYLMLLVIKKGQIMVISRQNPNGGPLLKTYSIQEDEETGVYGYPIGYCNCGERLLIRTLDLRDVVNRFGWSLMEYEEAKKRFKPKVPLRVKLVRLLGGKIDD